MANYFDKDGNYINVENLSLADIYHRAFALGVESVAIETIGEWIEIHVDRDILHPDGRAWQCSACHNSNSYGKPPFCMWCGAKMKNGRGNENDG